MAAKNVQLIWPIMANISIIIAITGFYIVLRGLYSNRNIFTLTYFVIALAIQVGINIVNAKAICNNDPSNNHIGYVFGYTLLPYFLILGSIMMIIIIFPGWKTPFSNTIGYLFVGGSIKKLLQSVFKNNNIFDKIKIDGFDISYFINELTENNFDSAFNNLKTQLGVNTKSNINSIKPKILKSIRFKHAIAEGIWYMLAGCLAVSISTNSILNIQC